MVFLLIILNPGRFWSRGPTVLLVEGACVTQKFTLTTITHRTDPEGSSSTASLPATRSVADKSTARQS